MMVRSVMIKYLEKTGEINFDKIFNQRLGFILLIIINIMIVIIAIIIIIIMSVTIIV